MEQETSYVSKISNWNNVSFCNISSAIKVVNWLKSKQIAVHFRRNKLYDPFECVFWYSFFYAIVQYDFFFLFLWKFFAFVFTKYKAKNPKIKIIKRINTEKLKTKRLP